MIIKVRQKSWDHYSILKPWSTSCFPWKISGPNGFNNNTLQTSAVVGAVH